MDLTELNLARLELTVQADTPANVLRRLPLLGGRFAAVCRELVCTRADQACGRCGVSHTCGWHRLFSQELATDPAELKLHQKPPLPFTFSFPTVVNEGDDIVVGLVVVGTAINHLDLLLEGFSRLVSEMSARVAAVDSLDYQGTPTSWIAGGRIVHPENLVVLSAGGVQENRSLCGSRLRLELLTPLRLLEQGRLRTTFDFGLFARTLMRRISSLAYYYGECTFATDFTELARQVNGVVCLDYSFQNAPAESRKLSGIGGSGLFEGDFTGIIPFLVLGELLHVGKGAAFDLGRFALTAE